MAKWSNIWEQDAGKEYPPHCSGKLLRKLLIESARFTKPAPVKRKVGGKYPHLQPFFRDRSQEEKVMSATAKARADRIAA